MPVPIDRLLVSFQPSKDLNVQRVNAMDQMKSDQITSDFSQVEEDIFFFDKIPDEAIERATEAWGAGAFTLGNCTGLGSCPA